MTNEWVWKSLHCEVTKTQKDKFHAHPPLWVDPGFTCLCTCVCVSVEAMELDREVQAGLKKLEGWEGRMGGGCGWDIK